MSDVQYCDQARVIADSRMMAVHNLSREVYDALHGIQDMCLMSDRSQQYFWSKIIAVEPIEVYVYTDEPPIGLASEAG